VLLTGIHLMRTGRIEANLLALNQEFRLPYITSEYVRLVRLLQDEPAAREPLNDLLVRVRLRA
jgi:hypothetical protein